jgi:homoserine kinase type II
MNNQDLIEFLNRRYAGPFTIQSRLKTNGLREAYRVQGPGGVYVVKLTDPGRAEQTVRADVGTPAYLASHGFPTPRPVPASDGRFYLPYGDRFAYLYEFLPGTHPRPSTIFYQRLGSLLARLHNLSCDGADIPESAYRPAEVLTNVRETLLQVGPADQRALVPELIEIIDNFPDFSGLPKGIIHTDPYLDNLIEGPDGSLALIDWEDGGISYPLLDVGYVLAHLSTFTARDREKWGVPGPPNGLLRRKDWEEQFMKAYETVRPLTESERSMLPDAVRMSFIVYIPMWGTDELIIENYERMHMAEE